MYAYMLIVTCKYLMLALLYLSGKYQYTQNIIVNI